MENVSSFLECNLKCNVSMLTLTYSETRDSCGSFTFQIIDLVVGRHHHLFPVLSISKLDIFLTL